MKIETALLAAQHQLARTSSTTPWLDGEVLLANFLGSNREYLAAHGERELTDREWSAYRRLIGRRAAGVPVAYLTGVKEFFDLTFAVNRHVLIPRPESEALVEIVLATAAPDSGVTIADIGTGSGNLAVAIARHRPTATVYATDRSAAALRVARRNARRHGVPIRFRHGDLLQPLSCVHLDVVVANLPYLPTAHAPQATPASLAFEPRAALWSGADGLHHYRQLLSQLGCRQQQPALVVCEMLGPQAQRFSTEAQRRWPQTRRRSTIVNGVAFVELTV